MQVRRVLDGRLSEPLNYPIKKEKDMQSEYLITFNVSDNICKNVEQFKNLLQANNEIKFTAKNTIEYKNNTFPVAIAQGNLPDNSIYYDLSITCNVDSNIDIFNSLLKDIRTICIKVNSNNANSIILLFDSIGEDLCKKAYPMIYSIENKMRKLIYKFMVISIGIDWENEAVPKEVNESIKKENNKIKNGLLQQVDFIQLSDFLFKKYSKNYISQLLDIIKQKNDNDKIDIVEVKNYIPKSNWEKFFAKRIDCESDYLKSSWEKLYDYRCKVAHCRTLTKIEYDDFEALCKDIGGKIDAALDSIGDIKIAASEREDLAENISVVNNDSAALFLSTYNQLSVTIQNICSLVSGEKDLYEKYTTNKTNLTMQVNYLFKNKKVLSKEECEILLEIQLFRNRFVHCLGLEQISEALLKDYTTRMKDIFINLTSSEDDERYTKLKDTNFSNEKESN
jgi:hypothetical protein